MIAQYTRYLFTVILILLLHFPSFAATTKQPQTGFVEVVFEETKVEALFKTYPFLSMDIDIIKNIDASTSTTTKLFVSEAHNSARKMKVLVIQREGEGFCARLGCLATVFVDEGRGYVRALDLMLSNNRLYLTSKKDVSLIICSQETGKKEEFVLLNHKFSFKRNLTEKDPPICH